jgi:hypothetical protein
MTRIAVLALALTVSACAIDKDTVRKFTYGPSFQFIDDTRLQDSMWRLARGVQDLDDTFQATAELSEDDRHKRIIEVLDYMSEAASAVSTPGQETQHKNMSMNIDRLITDIALAKTAAVSKDYGPAQQLPLTCLTCHQGGGGGPQK